MQMPKIQEKGASRAAARGTTQGEWRELPVFSITAGSRSWLGKIILQLQRYLEGRDF